jgi:hypothetical protein
MRNRRVTAAKSTKVPKVGCFFVVNGKPWVEGFPWTENLTVGGFRTYAVGHPEYWQRLQGLGVAPKDMPYERFPRGRVNYEDASDSFTLLADSCIVRKKTLVSAIMNELHLPRGTRVLTDDGYRCPKCFRERSTPKKGEEEDWDF